LKKQVCWLGYQTKLDKLRRWGSKALEINLAWKKQAVFVFLHQLFFMENLAHTPLDLSLQQASEGLFYLSEIDAPFTYFNWGPPQSSLPGAQQVRQVLGLGADTALEQLTLEHFLRNHAVEQEWHSKEDKQTVSRFQALKATLEAQLSHIEVFRIGQIEIEAYIIGLTKEGELAGLKTHLVET
jgi:hypothetical protein